MFATSAKIIQGLTETPVCGVQQAHEVIFPGRDDVERVQESHREQHMTFNHPLIFTLR